MFDPNKNFVNGTPSLLPTSFGYIVFGNVNNAPETNPPTILTTTVENIEQSISEFFRV